MKLLQKSCLFIGIFSCCFFSGAKTQAQNLIQLVDKQFTQYKNAAPKERVQIITDRDIYASGEMIWIHASVFDILSPKISTRSDVLNIQLFNSKSDEIFAKSFSLKNGSVSGFLKLPDNLEEGIHYLQGETKNSGSANSYFKKIIIKNNIVPPFVIKLKFKEKAYQPGDPMQLLLSFENFYKEPKKSVKYSLSIFDGDTKIYDVEGKTKKEASVSLNIEIPKTINSGIISYLVKAESKGVESSLEGILKVIPDDIIMEFYPENGSLLNGIPDNVHVFAYDIFGQPTAIEAKLYEDDKVVSLIQTDDNGLGTFTLTPQLDHRYYAVMTKPLQIEKHFELPPIKSNGIAFKVQHKTASEVEYQILSTKDAAQKIVLFGESDGKIFWSSEQNISGSGIVKIDLGKATGRLAHFIALSTSAKIEGEHVLAIPSRQPKPLDNKLKSSKFSSRSKVSCELSTSIQEGNAIFTAVNSPWMYEQLRNQHVQIVSLPYDISQQYAFKFFQSSEITDDFMELIANYYIPYNFGWDRVLNTKGVFSHPELSKEVMKNDVSLEKFIGKYKITMLEGAFTHSNLITDSKFAMSNPDYIFYLYSKKVERKAAYKVLLEKGTPVLDVIQSIKSYKLDGNKIVFFGTDNSFNFSGGALIVLDGINRGTDASIISGIYPQEVEKIFVSTDPNDMLRYSGLNSGGLVEIELKKGIDVSRSNVLEEDTPFSSPEYEHMQHGKNEDFRTTLHWEVRDIKGDGTINDLIYYNSDLIGKVSCIFYFLPKEGIPTVQYLEYEIK